MYHSNVIVPPLNKRFNFFGSSLSSPEWDSIALQVYSDYYNFDEKSSFELKECIRRMKILKEKAPPERSEGIHLIGPGNGFMGEDVYCVDGDLAHNKHLYCEICKNSSLIERKRKCHENDNNRILWCAICNDRRNYTQHRPAASFSSC